MAVCVALSPQLPNAFDHRVVAGDVTLVQDRGGMTTPCEKWPLTQTILTAMRSAAVRWTITRAIRLRSRALRWVSQLLARPQRRQSLAQVQQLLAEAPGLPSAHRAHAQSVPRPLRPDGGPAVCLPTRVRARSRRQTVVRIDVLVAASGQGGVIAGLTHLLLMVGLKTLALLLALGEHLV